MKIDRYSTCCYLKKDYPYLLLFRIIVEASLIPLSIIIIGIGNADFEKMYIYEITDFSGDIIDCNEGELRWIPIKDIYNYPMWEGDKVFLPLLINHQSYFRIRLTYENDILINTQKY